MFYKFILCFLEEEHQEEEELYVDIYVVDNSLDMTNYDKPITKFLRNLWTSYTPTLKKTFFVELSEKSLTTYDSLLFHSAGKTEVFYSLTKNHETAGADKDSFFWLNVELGHDKQVYTREYQKISTALAKVFGVLNIIFILGRLIIYPYSRLAFYLEGIHLVTRNSESDIRASDKEAAKNTKFVEGPKYFSLRNVWRLFFSSKSLPNQDVNNYFQIFKSSIEVKSIFYHFLEFKKLLLVVFDQDQQTVFHSLPRYIARAGDNISKRSSSNLASFLELEKFGLNEPLSFQSRYSKKIYGHLQTSLQRLKKVRDKDLFNRRILEYADRFNVPCSGVSWQSNKKRERAKKSEMSFSTPSEWKIIAI